MKKLVAICALLILLHSVFVFAQTTAGVSLPEVVKECLASGRSRDECFKLCLEYGGSDAECTRLLPEEPSLFQRFLNVFKGAPSEEETCCCLIGNNYYTVSQEACKQRQGVCSEDKLCEQVPPQRLTPDLGRPELRIPGKCELEKPEPVSPGRDIAGCDDCAVTVCFNLFHQEFLCLDGYKSCVEKYFFCRPVFCEPPKIMCGSCPECPPCEYPKDCCCQPYNQIMTETVCTQRQGKCADVSACKEYPDVCCQFLQTTAYIAPQILPENVCKEKRGSAVSMDVCRPQKDCCCQPYNEIMNEKACIERQGRCTVVETCKAENVCCQIGREFYEMPSDNCRARQGSMVSYEDCEKICCQYPQSTAVTYVAQTRPPEYVLRGACLLAGGQENPNACLPTFQPRTTPTLDVDTCRTWRCTPMTTTYAATSVTCYGTKADCETRYGYCVCAEGELPQAQPQPTPTLTTDVCCEIRTGYYDAIPKSQCKKVVADSYCKELTIQPRTITGARQISAPLTYVK